MLNFKGVFTLKLNGKNLTTFCNMLLILIYHFPGTTSATLTNVCLLLKMEIKSDVKRKISAGILPISRHLEAAGLPYLFSIISVITTSVLAVMMPQQVVICMF